MRIERAGESSWVKQRQSLLFGVGLEFLEDLQSGLRIWDEGEARKRGPEAEERKIWMKYRVHRILSNVQLRCLPSDQTQSGPPCRIASPPLDSAVWTATRPDHQYT